MRSFLQVIVLTAFLLAGCAKPEAPFVGKWKLDVASVSTGNAKEDEAIKRGGDRIVLEFKADKTCSISLGGSSGAGTYEVAGKVATMKQSNPTSQADMQPSTCTVSDDGKSLTLLVPALGTPLKFLKQPG